MLNERYQDRPGDAHTRARPRSSRETLSSLARSALSR